MRHGRPEDCVTDAWLDLEALLAQNSDWRRPVRPLMADWGRRLRLSVAPDSRALSQAGSNRLRFLRYAISAPSGL
jgi:hypothetical protein